MKGVTDVVDKTSVLKLELDSTEIKFYRLVTDFSVRQV
jgi:hypothetical protein